MENSVVISLFGGPFNNTKFEMTNYSGNYPVDITLPVFSITEYIKNRDPISTTLLDNNNVVYKRMYLDVYMCKDELNRYKVTLATKRVRKYETELPSVMEDFLFKEIGPNQIKESARIVVSDINEYYERSYTMYCLVRKYTI